MKRYSSTVKESRKKHLRGQLSREISCKCKSRKATMLLMKPHLQLCREKSSAVQRNNQLQGQGQSHLHIILHWWESWDQTRRPQRSLQHSSFHLLHVTQTSLKTSPQTCSQAPWIQSESKWLKITVEKLEPNLHEKLVLQNPSLGSCPSEVSANYFRGNTVFARKPVQLTHCLQQLLKEDLWCAPPAQPVSILWRLGIGAIRPRRQPRTAEVVENCCGFLWTVSSLKILDSLSSCCSGTSQAPETGWQELS